MGCDLCTHGLEQDTKVRFEMLQSHLQGKGLLLTDAVIKLVLQELLGEEAHRLINPMVILLNKNSTSATGIDLQLEWFVRIRCRKIWTAG